MSIRKHIRQQAKKGRFVTSAEVDYFPGSQSVAVYLLYPDSVDFFIVNSPIIRIKPLLLNTFSLFGINDFKFNELTPPSVH